MSGVEPGLPYNRVALSNYLACVQSRKCHSSFA